MNKRSAGIVGIILLLFTASLQAQTPAAQKENSSQPLKNDQPKAAAKVETDDNVVMLQEIVIQVSPEQPIVVIYIPRQKPDIKPASIQSPLERMVSMEDRGIKPDLTKMKVNKVEELDKMLAQTRAR